MQARRAERARRLLRDKEAEFTVHNNRRMTVPSQQVAHAPYTVRLRKSAGRRYDLREPASGTCPDYRYRRPAAGCKHMLAAEEYLRKHAAERRWKL